MQHAALAVLLCLGAFGTAAAEGSVANGAVAARAAQMPGSSTSPVSRIVELLQMLKGQCEADHKRDETLYEKFVCWGKQVIMQKEAANKAASAEVAELTQYIDDLDNGRIELTSERVDLEKEISDLSTDIEVAKAQRKKENDDFTMADEEMTAALTALNKAEDVLKTATDDHKTGVLAEIKVAVGHRAEHEAKEAKVLNHAADLGDRFLNKGDAMFLRRLLTGEVPTADWKKLNRKATFKMSYKARSFKIQDVIAELIDTFERNQKEAQDKEDAAKAAWTELDKAKNDELDSAQGRLTTMTKENGAKTLSKTDAQDRIDLLNEQISNDEKYIDQVKGELTDKKKEWMDRSELMLGEIEAMAKAIEILHNDDARDLFKKSLASQGYFFLQTGQHAPLHDATSVLSSVARKSSDKRVLALITEMQKEPAFGSLKGEFKPIIDKIDTLVGILEAEEVTDTEHKEDCETSRAEWTRTAIKLSREIDDDTDTMTRLTSEMEALSMQIKENDDAIAVVESQIKEAEEQRKSENEAYLIDKKNDEDAATTVQQAWDVLDTFYKDKGLMLLQKRARAPVVVDAGKAPPPPPPTWEDPYAGKTGESTGVLAILSMIKEDIERDESKATAAETKAQETFDALKADLEAEKKSREQSNSKMDLDKTAKQGTHIDTEGDRKLSKTELDDSLKTIAKMEPTCNYFTINFPVRVKNRQIEMDGLLKAKAILQGADTDPAKEKAAEKWKNVPRILRPKEFQFRQAEQRASAVNRHQ